MPLAFVSLSKHCLRAVADKGLAGVLVLVAGVLNVDVKVHLCGSTTGGCFGVAYSNTRRIQGFLRFAKAKAKGEDPNKEGGFIRLYNKMLELGLSTTSK